MLAPPWRSGLDLRLCEASQCSPAFAEGTEAFLYRNDFFPFVRAELARHDPKLHELLAKIWGP